MNRCLPRLIGFFWVTVLLALCWYQFGAFGILRWQFLVVANSIGLLSALQLFFWRRRWGIVLLNLIRFLVCARYATSFDIRWASASHRTAVANLTDLGGGSFTHWVSAVCTLVGLRRRG